MYHSAERRLVLHTSHWGHRIETASQFETKRFSTPHLSSAHNRPEQKQVDIYIQRRTEVGFILLCVGVHTWLMTKRRGCFALALPHATGRKR